MILGPLDQFKNLYQCLFNKWILFLAFSYVKPLEIFVIVQLMHII